VLGWFTAHDKMLVFLPDSHLLQQALLQSVQLRH
jgi:hypothetical protein